MRAAALALLVVACGGGHAGAGRPTAPVKRGPVVTLTLPAIDGEGVLSVGRLRGRVVVLHFFATWSMASQLDVPELQRARAAGAEILGVALDPDGATLVRPWRDAAGVDYPIALGDASALSAGQDGLAPVRAVPTTVVLDPEGRVAWRRDGAGLVRGELVRVVQSLGAPPRRP